jgi:hypothetical protein
MRSHGYATGRHWALGCTGAKTMLLCRDLILIVIVLSLDCLLRFHQFIRGKDFSKKRAVSNDLNDNS